MCVCVCVCVCVLVRMSFVTLGTGTGAGLQVGTQSRSCGVVFSQYQSLIVPRAFRVDISERGDSRKLAFEDVETGCRG